LADRNTPPKIFPLALYLILNSPIMKKNSHQEFQECFIKNLLGRLRLIIIISFLSIAAGIYSENANATARTWNGSGVTGGTGSTDFNNVANWNPSTGILGAADDLTMTLTNGAIITLSADITVNSLTCSVSGNNNVFRLDAATHILTINGTCTANVTSGNVNTQMQLNVGNAGGFIIGGAANFGTNGSGRATFPLLANGGTTGQFTFKGDVTFGADAGTSLGNNPAKVIFDAAGTQTITDNAGANIILLGTTSTEIGSSNNPTVVVAGSASLFQPQGNLNINGTSTLNLGIKTFNRNTAGGTINMAAGSTLKLGGTTGGQAGSNFPSNFSAWSLNATSTVAYTGGSGTAQTIFSSPTYGNLTLDITNGASATTKSAGGALTAVGLCTVGASATLNLNNFAVTVGSLTGSGTIQNSVAGAKVLTVGSNNTSTLFSGTIVAGTGEVSLTKTGTGTLSLGTNAIALNTLIISTGGLTSTSGTMTLTADFTNSSTFTHNSGTVTFSSASANQNLTGATTFNNLTLNKANGKNVILASNITVNNALTLTLGTLQTNANTVTLAAAATISEAAGQTVLGNLTKTKVFSSPDNFGGMGITITEASAMGTTTVTRVTGTDVVPNGFAGIKRYFDITPTNNSGLNATLVFKYDNTAPASELNGNSAASLRLLRSADLIYYEDMGGVVAGSTITLSAIDHFSRWTASSNCYTWTGAISTDWSVAGNWQCGAVPNSSTANPTIPSGKPRYPVITGAQSFSVRNIVIAAGASVTNNGTFSMAGSFTNSGTFTSTSGTIVMNSSSGAQTIPAGTFSSNTIKGLTISNASGVTLGGNLTLTDVLSFGNVNNSVLTTGGFLTLHSDVTNTARIADLTNNGVNSGNDVSGDVTVERWMHAGTADVPAGDRAYRLIAPSVNTSTTIHANWQEGATYRGDNPNPGYGTHITGVGIPYDQMGGFDGTITGEASLFLFNGTGWASIANTNATNLNAKTGYLLFVRGDRSYDLDQPPGGPFISHNTTLRAKGNVLTGQQDFTGLSGTAGANVLVTNPYASPLDWTKVYALAANTTNYENYVTLWDPHIGTRGGYVTVTSTGITSPGTSAATTQIQSGEAFFLTVKSGAANPSTFTVKEQHKGTVNNLGVFRPMAQQPKINALLYLNDAVLGRRNADGAVAIYDDSYNSSIDGNDALQFSNMDEDIAFIRNGQKLSIETRPLIIANDTLFVFMQRMKSMNYQWEINSSAFDPSLTAELVDNYTGIRTLLDLGGTTTINFNVNTAIAGSKATNRFYIVFHPAAPLPVTLSNIKAYQHSAGINVDWSVNQQSNMDRYEVERSLTGANFLSSGTVAASAISGVASYTWFDANPNIGVNFYRIKMTDKNGAYSYSQVVKVIIGRKVPSITIYPNPVIGNIITLQLTNLDKGTYSVSIINNVGQEVYSNKIIHGGGSSAQTIEIDRKLAHGTYQLKLVGEQKSFTTQVMKE